MNFGVFILLLLTTASWGISYVATRWVIPFYDASWILALRFLISTIIISPIIFLDWKEFKRSLKLTPVICGVILFIAIYLQIKGLEYTTIAKSSFITALFAFFVPLFTVFFDKKKLGTEFWILLSTALFGVLLMCDMDISTINYGDGLTLICSVFCASHIYIVGKKADEMNPLFFVLVQNFVIGICALTTGLLTHGVPSFEVFTHGESYSFSQVGFGFIILTFLCTLIAFTFQIYAQRKIPAHIAGLVFLMESPFAAFFGFVILKEEVSSMGLAGAVIIVASVALIPYLSKFLNLFKPKLKLISKHH